MSLYIGNSKLMNFTMAIEDTSKIGSVVDSKATTNLTFDIMADPAFTFESNDFTMEDNYDVKTGTHGTVKSKILDVINANGRTMYIKCSVCRINTGTADSTDYIRRDYVVYATYNENNEPTVYDMYWSGSLYLSYNNVDADFWYNNEDNFILSFGITSYDINYNRIYEKQYPNLVISVFLIKKDIPYIDNTTQETRYITTLYLRTISKNLHASNELSNYSFNEDDTEVELFGANTSGVVPGEYLMNTYTKYQYVLGDITSDSVLGNYNIQDDGIRSNYKTNYFLSNVLTSNPSGNYTPVLPGSGEGSTSGGNIPNQNSYPNGRGGDGTKDFGGDNENIPTVPTSGAVSSGFINAYLCDAVNLQNLKTFLFSDTSNTAIEGIKRIYNNPIDAISGLSVLPISKSDIETNVANIYIGTYDTGVQSNKINNDFIQIDFGSLDFTKGPYETYLDYQSNIYIYLPYSGTYQLRPQDVFHTSLRLIAHINVLNGDVIYFIYGKNGNTENAKEYIIANYSGNCAYEIPISSRNIGQAMSGAVQAATSVTGLIPNTLNTISSLSGKGENISNVAGNFGNIASAIFGVANGFAQASNPQVSLTGGVSSSKIMESRTPKIILQVPKILSVEGIQNKKGSLSYYEKSIEDVKKEKGKYVEYAYINIDIPEATEQEKALIDEYLRSGVIL